MTQDRYLGRRLTDGERRTSWRGCSTMAATKTSQNRPTILNGLVPTTR
jgi:hypothetical protein